MQNETKAAAAEIPEMAGKTIKVGDPGSAQLHEALYHATAAVAEIRALMGLRSSEATRNLHVNAKYEPGADLRLVLIKTALEDALAEIGKVQEARLEPARADQRERVGNWERS